MSATFSAPTAVIVWNDVADKLPDAEIEVLVATRESADANQAYLFDIDDGQPVFAYVNSGMLVRGTVYAWAEMPAAPARSDFKKGGA